MSTILITGGHAGIGFECAQRIAASGTADLILAGRDLGRVETAAETLRGRYGVRARALELDLASFASTRAAAAHVRSMVECGDVDVSALLMNAGAQFHGPVSFGADGYEETFTVNCLGNFLFVNLVLDRLSSNARIVFTASGTHDPKTMDGRMVGAAAEPDAKKLAVQGKDSSKVLSGGVRYTTSKLCTVMQAYELDRRLRAAGSAVTSVSFDPGYIPETGLARTAPRVAVGILRSRAGKALFRRLGVTMGSLTAAGRALADLAVDPAYRGWSGTYYQSQGDALANRRSSQVSYDAERAARLWEDCAQLVRLTPEEMPATLTPVSSYD